MKQKQVYIRPLTKYRPLMGEGPLLYLTSIEVNTVEEGNQEEAETNQALFLFGDQGIIPQWDDPWSKPW